MQGRYQPIAFSLFTTNSLLRVLLTKVLSIIQACSQKGGDCRTAAPPQIEILKIRSFFKL